VTDFTVNGPEFNAYPTNGVVVAYTKLQTDRQTALFYTRLFFYFVKIA